MEFATFAVAALMQVEVVVVVMDLLVVIVAKEQTCPLEIISMMIHHLHLLCIIFLQEYETI